MPSRAGGADSGFRTLCLCKCRGRVLLLIVVSVVAQLIVFAGGIRKFNSFAGPIYFHDKASLTEQLTNENWKDLGNNLQSKGNTTLQNTFRLPSDRTIHLNASISKESFNFNTPGKNGTSIGEGQELVEISGDGNISKRVESGEKELNLGQNASRLSVKVQGGVTRRHGRRNSKNMHRGSSSLVGKLRDQVAMAEVYIKNKGVRNNHHLLQELRLRIQEIQHVLGHSHLGADLPRSATEKMKAMAQTLSKVREHQNKCKIMEKRLRSMISSTEEEVWVLKSEISFLGQLAAKTVPKGLHCLGMRLTTEYYSHQLRPEQISNEKLQDLGLYHFIIFTDNILAASVVVNSTIFHVEDPAKHCFHICTNSFNYAAMKMWFLVNTLGNCTVEVRNMDDTLLNSSKFEAVRDYFKGNHANYANFRSSNLKHQDYKNYSTYPYLHFFLPDLYPKLDKILLLDDDIVVQKDLSPLWNVSLHGNFQGVVGIYRYTQNDFQRHLDFSGEAIFKNSSLNSWIGCLRMFDLNEWRRQVTAGNFDKWQMKENEQLLQQGKVSSGLDTFYNFFHSLDTSWYVLDLNDSSTSGKNELKNASVIHYSGSKKPWLGTGMSMYNSHWNKFVNYNHPFLQECNIGQ